MIPADSPAIDTLTPAAIPEPKLAELDCTPPSPVAASPASGVKTSSK